MDSLTRISIIIFALVTLQSQTGCGVGSIEPDISAPEITLTSSREETNPLTATITLTWTPPTEYTNLQPMHDLSGYNIYFGSSPEQLERLVTIDANLTSYVIENDIRILANERYYFGMTAFTSNNLDSPMSNIAIYDGTNLTP